MVISTGALKLVIGALLAGSVGGAGMAKVFDTAPKVDTVKLEQKVEKMDAALNVLSQKIEKLSVAAEAAPDHRSGKRKE